MLGEQKDDELVKASVCIFSYMVHIFLIIVIMQRSTNSNNSNHYDNKYRYNIRSFTLLQLTILNSFHG